MCVLLTCPQYPPSRLAGPPGRQDIQSPQLSEDLAPSYLSLLFSLTKGGYNLISISESMAACTRSLLGDSPPLLTLLRPPLSRALASIAETTQIHRRYWRSLRVTSEGAWGIGGGSGGSGEGRD